MKPIGDSGVYKVTVLTKRGAHMKKTMMVFTFGLILSLCAATVFAAGGKNHGELGQGDVIQNQICVDDNGSPSF